MSKCYFAYTWDDDDTNLPEFLGILKDMIEDYSDGNIEVIFDKKSFKTGDNFEEKEELICESDSIVIFFSPNYKTIVDIQDENKGVYREYKKIILVKEKHTSAIIPVVVKGNEKNAITNEFKKYIATKFELDEIFTKELKEKKIEQEYFWRVENLVKKIIKETNLAHKKKDYEFDSIDDMMEILFGESAANKKLPNRCMYETDAYISVLAQNRRYIIGRKGSGKTTFLSY